MAHQLFRQGEDVRLLCLLIPPSLLLSPKYPKKDLLSQSASFTSRIKHFFNRMSARSYDEKIDGILRAIRRSRILRKIKVAVCKSCVFFGFPIPSILRKFYYLEWP